MNVRARAIDSSRGEIGVLLGLDRATVSRALRRLARHGVITLDGARVRHAPDHLRARAPEP